MWLAIRKVIFWTHLTAGLVAAIVVGVMCVTGVLLTYERQMVVWAGSPYVDAYSGAVIGDESRAIREFFAAVIRWHTALGVSGPQGRPAHEAVRVINAIFVFLVLFGILLWIPRVWTWRHLRGVLLFRSGISGQARDFNWHNVIGIWSVVPLLVVAWTAMAMSYGWARRLTNQVVGVPNPEWHGGTPVPAAGSLTLDDLLARADRSGVVLRNLHSDGFPSGLRRFRAWRRRAAALLNRAASY